MKPFKHLQHISQNDGYTNSVLEVFRMDGKGDPRVSRAGRYKGEQKRLKQVRSRIRISSMLTLIGLSSHPSTLHQLSIKHSKTNWGTRKYTRLST
ncbi:unnamed protein product [Nezara viridula]|uniref:Uncharacterized protein n=1 Tax=Nezara viridula TaxID=85310 RepID=A0A9P0H108_NEZVI|nr:unnamed protein product [Nezara viridula]